MTKQRELPPILLTDAILNAIDFKKRVVGMNPDGTLQTEPTPDKMKDWFVKDSELQGFSARITGKAFPGTGKGIQFYAKRKLASMTVKFKIGAFPTLTVKKAREAASRALGLMANGIDPRLEKKKAIAEVRDHRARAKLTFGFVVARDAINRAEVDKPKTKRDRADVAKWMSNLPIWNTPVSEVDVNLIQDTMNLQPCLRQSSRKQQTLRH